MEITEYIEGRLLSVYAAQANVIGILAGVLEAREIISRAELAAIFKRASEEADDATVAALLDGISGMAETGTAPTFTVIDGGLSAD